jgi:hypothetical protein
LSNGGEHSARNLASAPSALDFRHRRRRLLASTAILLAGCLVFSSRIWANECGPAPVVICDEFDPYYDTDFPNGIIYLDVTNLDMTFGDNVYVHSYANGLTISAQGAVDIEMASDTVINSVFGAGIQIYTADTVDLIAYKITANYTGTAIRVTNTGNDIDDHVTIDVRGDVAGAIFDVYVVNTVGNVNVTVSGTLSTNGYENYADRGIWIDDTDGNVSITVADTGNVNTYNQFGDGIRVTYGSVAPAISVVDSLRAGRAGDRRRLPVLALLRCLELRMVSAVLAARHR